MIEIMKSMKLLELGDVVHSTPLLVSKGPGHWLETQILRPHSRLAESDPWSEPGSPHLASLLGGVDTA